MMKLRPERGQSMAEFAISAVVFFTVILFIMDGGRILWHYVSLSEASRVAARYAITHGSKTPEDQRLTMGNYNAVLRDQIRQKTPALDTPDLTVRPPTWEDPVHDPGTMVTITLDFRVRPITAAFWRSEYITLHSYSAMTIQH